MVISAYSANKNMTAEDTGGVIDDFGIDPAQDAKDRMDAWQRDNTDFQNWDLSFESDWNQTDDNIAAASGGSGAFDELRTHNAANQIATLAKNGSGDHGGNWVDPTYDAAGSMTLRPDPSDPSDANDAQKLTYDAWNRLVKIENNATGDDIADYEYDGLNRRISKRLDTTANGTIDSSDDARHYYYNGQQVIEEADDPSGGTYDIDKRFVWGKRYIDDLIAREHDPDGDNTFTRHYTLHDRSWNIIALADDAGDIVERYRYTPYGDRTVLRGAGCGLMAWIDNRISDQ